MTLVKRSITIGGHRTSVALEPEFWRAIEAWAAAEEVSLAHLVARVDSRRGHRGLASALRVATLEHAATERQRADGDATDPT